MQTNRLMLVAVLTALFTLPLSASADEEAAILGTWLVKEKTGKIQIFKCGKKYCGKTVWLEPSTEHPDPSTIIDVHNPDPTKRSRKVLGSTMLWGLTYDKDDERWEDGQIYDNRSGKIYKCQVTLDEGGKKLHLRGYIGFSLIGGTTTWTRLK